MIARTPSQASSTSIVSATAAAKAAQVAAASPHALVDLTRLVKSLESRAPQAGAVDDSPVLDVNQRDNAVQRDRENLVYARALHDALSGQNEGSSTTSSLLARLADELVKLEGQYTSYIAHSSETISAPLSRVQSRNSKRQSIAADETAASSVDAIQPSIPSSEPANRSEIRQRKPRKGPTLNAYLQKREEHSRSGGEAGLVSLPNRHNGASGAAGAPIDAEKQREQLLASKTSRSVMSGAQLHDELGGQLAQMSHQLKLNALHFANSLEEEKVLLETSQEALENNLVATKSSKTQLSAVTRKGRGTTCMTLGIILLVMIIFIWTYMLIRFT